VPDITLFPLKTTHIAKRSLNKEFETNLLKLYNLNNETSANGKFDKRAVFTILDDV
jgi:hypothetical protein